MLGSPECPQPSLLVLSDSPQSPPAPPLTGDWRCSFSHFIKPFQSSSLLRGFQSVRRFRSPVGDCLGWTSAHQPRARPVVVDEVCTFGVLVWIDNVSEGRCLIVSEWEEAFGRPDCVVVDEEGFYDRRVVFLDEVADEHVLVHCGHEARPSFVVGDLACDGFKVSCGRSEKYHDGKETVFLGVFSFVVLFS
jgi:hypothetical protein